MRNIVQKYTNKILKIIRPYIWPLLLFFCVIHNLYDTWANERGDLAARILMRVARRAPGTESTRDCGFTVPSNWSPQVKRTGSQTPNGPHGSYPIVMSGSHFGPLASHYLGPPVFLPFLATSKPFPATWHVFTRLCRIASLTGCPPPNSVKTRAGPPSNQSQPHTSSHNAVSCLIFNTDSPDSQDNPLPP